MPDDLTQRVEQEVARIVALPIEEQPAAFAALRDLLENTLNSVEDQGASANQGA
jgi:hypothetical protein